MTYKYKYAYMHQALSIPGLGINLQRVMDNKKENKTAVHMERSPDGVLCKYKGCVFIIPFVNFQVLVPDLDSAEKEAPAAKPLKGLEAIEPPPSGKTKRAVQEA